MRRTAVLLVDCPDAKGIVATVSSFLYSHGANILSSDQHQDNEACLFFMRVEFDLADFTLDMADFAREFQPIADRYHMRWRCEETSALARVAIFVSRYQHCLVDLLHRHQIGELRCQIALIVSNHEDARPLAEFYKVPFHHVPVNGPRKDDAEGLQIDLLEKSAIDLIVLARYMQVLSPAFVARYPLRIVNVHHSFLPAFSGARPYHAAFQRGVKIIGATSHYVTDELDAGPIIEQDVARVSHRNQVDQLIEKGRDLEKVVLSRAVRWHLEHRILFYGNKTVVFD
ncbi:MAG TPA: formyltetrahydrofolate deformylase [Bryobacteraceae bacterium]|nr:formyltetrahydrofolate deformylase [Bryobacteraceae bacterium]